MKDNLSFEKTPNVSRASKAVIETHQKFAFTVSFDGFISCFDKDTGNIMFFFPMSDFLKNDKKSMDNFFSELKENLEKVGFEIVEKRKVESDEYLNIGFDSMVLVLKSLN